MNEATRDAINAGIQKFRETHIQQNGLTPAQTEERAYVAGLASRVNTMSLGVRTRKVRPIKAKIAEGVYDNDLKLSIALDRLLEDLGMAA